MDQEAKFIAKITFTIIFGFIGFVTLFQSCEMVSTGSRGVITRFGAVQNRIMEEGFNFKKPFVESVTELDVQTQKIQVEAPSFSKDLQNVDTLIALNYHLDPLKVNHLYQEIGMDYEGRIVGPAIQESVKAATAKFTAEQLISERHSVKEEIKIHLIERLTPRYIIVDDFSIVDFKFSESYQHAIEQKQVAQQDALKAENELRRIKVEAEQKIATAQADAEAIKIQAQAITSQGGRDYVQLQAIKKWDGKLPAQMIPGATVPFIDLSK